MTSPVEMIGSFQDKMSMGGGSASSSKATCKISMLWNWYTIDTCFIARSWRNDTKGKFAGSCIGCFALVVIAQWLNRVSRQFDIELVKKHKMKYLAQYMATNGAYDDTSSELSQQDLESICNEPAWKSTIIALQRTLSHTWYFNFLRRNPAALDDPIEKALSCCSSVPALEIYPTFLEHFTRAWIFVLQWGLSYIIMLLFMYYNGYIIISCLIGALVGRFLFNYEPLGSCGSGSSNTVVAHDKEENDRKCCM